MSTAKDPLDHPEQLSRHGDTISIDLWYPPRPGSAPGASNSGNATRIEVGLCDVRAADSIRISYDFNRDGYVIEQAAPCDEGDDEEATPDWQEVAFVRAWAREKKG
jgi:hypothetical protein